MVGMFILWWKMVFFFDVGEYIKKRERERILLQERGFLEFSDCQKHV